MHDEEFMTLRKTDGREERKKNRKRDKGRKKEKREIYLKRYRDVGYYLNSK